MHKMKRISGVLVVVLAGLFVAASMAEERDASLYVGTKSCRMCHKKESSGNQYQKWLDGPHSKTIAILGTPEAKEVAKKAGVEDPQKSGKCLKCHSTAYNWTETVQTEKVTVEDGVTCESCHGPGKNYKSKSTMQSREKSIAGGMVHPALEKSCTKCHNDTSPTWKPDRYTTKDGKKVGFDPEQAYAKIKHPNPNVSK